jgi:hypothetical protein
VIPDDLKLQMGPDHMVGRTADSRHGEFRFARPNGWHCGHWHPTITAAWRCLKAQVGTKRVRRAA